jgi:L-arabinose isomerase
MTPPPHIAVIAGYMPFFDEIMPPGHPAERAAAGRAAVAAVAGLGRVTDLGLMTSAGEGEAAGRRLAGLDADAVLLVPTMATPATFLWNAIAPHPRLPVVIWAAHEAERIEPDYDMVALCRHSQNVGALQIGNMLARAGRPFAVIAGPRDDPATRSDLADALRVAALAGRLRHGRLGRLGAPLEGYLNVDVDSAALQAATGLQVQDIPLAEWSAALDAVPEAALDAAMAGTDTTGDPAALRTATRHASALLALTDRHGLIGGALNCRGTFGTAHPRHPSLGCLALTQACGAGTPYTCTGDLITAVAMVIGRALGGAALYCELDAIDTGRDAFLVANTGEGDPGWGPARVFASAADSGRRAPGASVRQTLRPGPATLIGFTPAAGARGGFRLIALEGQVEDPAPEVALTVTSAWFRATRTPMRRAFAAWAEAGATHHGALAPGHLAGQLGLLARYMGIEATAIPGGTP